MNINLQPNICNLCFGKVIYTSNSLIYGREYGIGKCYYCVECKSYVGTHRPRPKEALGLLANEQMRNRKKICHNLFDKHWNGRNQRNGLYKWLANELEIDGDMCHFGYFDIDMLLKAYKVLKNYENKKPFFSKKGNVKHWG